ncbi:unnamed protein product, partial [Amoebophrya sp. A120]|eukprot:GSA120T00023985001.1
MQKRENLAVDEPDLNLLSDEFDQDLLLNEPIEEDDFGRHEIAEASVAAAGGRQEALASSTFSSLPRDKAGTGRQAGSSRAGQAGTKSLTFNEQHENFLAIDKFLGELGKQEAMTPLMLAGVLQTLCFPTALRMNVTDGKPRPQKYMNTGLMGVGRIKGWGCQEFTLSLSKLLNRFFDAWMLPQLLESGAVEDAKEVHFTTTTLNNGVNCCVHVDGKNSGVSYAISVGGRGSLAVFDREAAHEDAKNPPSAAHVRISVPREGPDLKEYKYLRGKSWWFRVHDTSEKAVQFDARIPHLTHEAEIGRFAILFYPHEGYATLKNR